MVIAAVDGGWGTAVKCPRLGTRDALACDRLAHAFGDLHAILLVPLPRRRALAGRDGVSRRVAVRQLLRRTAIAASRTVMGQNRPFRVIRMHSRFDPGN